ncbi:tRNA (adenine(22)-N(1))-methyltransferase [Planctomycetaceae bacterium SH139]
MPRLDARLQAVARQIRCPVHADIGSDHGHLLKALLAAGRIERGIAIENKPLPLANSQATLAGWAAEVRLADGLAGLQAGEVDSLSICGMGGEAIVKILTAAPERLPQQIIVQPNSHPQAVRRWGLDQGFQLIHEELAKGHWNYTILRFNHTYHSKKPYDNPHDDPCYDGLDLSAALLFGPHLLRRRDPRLVAQLAEEERYLQSLERLTDDSRQRLTAIERVRESLGVTR